MIPANGAYTRWKPCRSSSRCTFASLAATVARAASTAFSAVVTLAVFSSICCFETVPAPADQ